MITRRQIALLDIVPAEGPPRACALYRRETDATLLNRMSIATAGVPPGRLVSAQADFDPRHASMSMGACSAGAARPGTGPVVFTSSVAVFGASFPRRCEATAPPAIVGGTQRRSASSGGDYSPSDTSTGGATTGGGREPGGFLFAAAHPRAVERRLTREGAERRLPPRRRSAISGTSCRRKRLALAVSSTCRACV
jgi:hypothetical protein